MPRSPFICVHPVSGTNFFGRKTELARILSDLSSETAVNIFSQSRMGKSSLLYEIKRLCETTEGWSVFAPVFVDCYISSEILPTLCEKLQIDACSWNRVEQGIERKYYNDGRKLLLLLDEGQKLAQSANGESELMALRSLHQKGRLNVVMSTLHGSIIDHLINGSHHASPFYSIFDFIEIPAFPADDAIIVLRDMSSRGGHEFSEQMAHQIATYVGGHPNLIQQLGSVAFEAAQNDGALSFDEIKLRWLHGHHAWPALLVSLFKHEIGTYGKTPGVDPERRLARSLEAYGILRRNPSGNLAFAPYVDDLLGQGLQTNEIEVKSTIQSILKRLEQPKENEIRDVLERSLRFGFRDQPPQSEKELQRLIEVSLSAAGFRFEREGPTFLYSLKRFRPDHVLAEGRLALESKLCRGPSDVSRVVEEMSADINPYLEEFDEVLFIVFDLGGIHDVSQFAEDFERNPRLHVLVIKR